MGAPTGAAGVAAAMICYRCRQQKPAEAFYKTMPTKCKECQKAQMKAHYREPEYKRRNAEYQRERLQDAEKHAKHIARRTLGNAVRLGKVFKPDICLACGSDENVEAHHEDYSRPLEVEWWCRNCHATYHAEEAAKQRQVKDKDMSISGETDQVTHTIHYATINKNLT